MKELEQIMINRSKAELVKLLSALYADKALFIDFLMRFPTSKHWRNEISEVNEKIHLLENKLHSYDAV